MKRATLACAVIVGIFISCSEKCPLEPYREFCGDLYGEVRPPAGIVLPLRDLRVRSLISSCGLNRDLSFCLPGLMGTGTGVLAVTARDTLPVMLGYVFPGTVCTRTGDGTPLELDPELRNAICTKSGGVNLSASSTTLTLIMLSPLLGGATVEERAWFAARAVRHALFEELADDVGAALAVSYESALDSDVNPGLYTKAASIVSNLIDLERRIPEGGLGSAPYVIDAPGDYVRLINPACAHFGVRLAAEGQADPDTVFLLRGRGVGRLVNPDAVVPCEYALGTGRFDIEFFKGFRGFAVGQRLNRQHPGGMGTIANAEHLIWNLITIYSGLPEMDGPGNLDLADAGWVNAVSEAIESGDMETAVALAAEYLYASPRDLSDWFGEPVDRVLDAERFLASTRRILAANAASLQSAGLASRLPFYASLFTASYHESLLVCQLDGAIIPCENAPLLTNGSVSPASGYTDTLFTFAVSYYDIEGQPPTFIAAVVDDIVYGLTLAEGREADGTYSVSTGLPGGKHVHYFECIDTNGDYARLPAGATFEGPLVLRYPKLGSGWVRPKLGSPSDVYEYAVWYYDADLDAPDWVRVVVDGEPHDMSLALGEDFDGTYAYGTRLDVGPHTFHFECSDATGAPARYPEIGEIHGPSVKHAPELSGWRVSPPRGSTLTVFEYEVHYDHKAEVPPISVVVHIDDSRRTMTLKSGVPESGTYWLKTHLARGYHTCYFEAADTVGLVGRLPATGRFGGPAVYAPEGKNPDAKVAVHVRTHNPRAGCDYGSIEGCSDITYTVPDWDVDAFPVFFDLVEYIGVEYGLTWPDWMSSAAWYSCSDLSVGEIRRPGDGAANLWSSCQTGVAVPGYIWLYAYSPGWIYACPHPQTGQIIVLDCDYVYDEPIAIFGAGVYGATGDNPCFYWTRRPESPGSDRNQAGYSSR